jgi:REP element-mobilizing transposase RayT
MAHDPLAYFITFTTYGTWLHGQETGSVDPGHNEYGTEYLPADPAQRAEAAERMDQPPYGLDAARRRVVLATVQEVCRHRGWYLLACHVRTNHAHTVVQATAAGPEKVMNDLKAYASRRLAEAGFETKERKRWTRHGSTRYLWKDDQVLGAVDYVVNRQGEPMEVYVAPDERKATSRTESEPRP